MKGMLTVEDHNRDVVGLKYVYPVVSRRAGGVSVGINLNPNNACNWHCVYCQVPELKRGRAPVIDIDRLERELEHMLSDIRDGDFMARYVDQTLRRLCDIAFSGNGEPTSAAGFADIVTRVGTIRERFGYGDEVPLRLITNGSLVGQEGVLDGIGRLAGFNGEVWFKVDAASPDDIRRINGVERDAGQMARQLALCAVRCPTWVQTCMFAWDREPPNEPAIQAYLELLRRAAADGVRGVLLYGVARPSLQPEADRVSRLPREWLERLGQRIVSETGLTTSVSP